MNAFVKKLSRIAADMAAEKPKLHFFGLVHRADAPDLWDLLVSSDKLEPWSMQALRYVAARLKKVLTAEELVKISRIVVLPRKNKAITALTQNPQIRLGEISFLHPADRFDQAVVIWPAEKARQEVHATR
jgi:hypothetical protein